ncbi:hypothetical protein GCM10008959_40050 [Deinococcus seoulensis]|uniref:Uncharacterized protein n=1 Tax=Deinococcus seoulensis TaxID=1837379 RepID=A0ABQ2RYE2_9DEIO|nr:hypothetical protein [Deinococcus seoulensis]GGR74863.1 hypothetical protein GCM10008959_40050 [Deinococcus seoulensis]
MTLPPSLTTHPLLNPDLPPHRQLPGDTIMWTQRGWPAERFTAQAHVWTEREARLSRQLGAQSELDRLTR